MPRREDPVLTNARREAIAIGLIWLTATLYCCFTCYFLGYIRPGRLLGATDLRPILGIPRWFFWGVVAPWGVFGLVSWAFVGWFMTDDDLGPDHAAELDADIREGGSSHGG
jgi:hypothetical protein